MRTILGLLLAGAGVVMTGPATALNITLLDTSIADPEETLINAVLADNPGITIVPGSVQFIGRIGDGNEAQSAIYSNLMLAPASGTGPTVEQADGIFLTTGIANIPLENTVNNFSHTVIPGVSAPPTGSNAMLEDVVNAATNNQNVLSFDFTVDDPNATSLDLDFVFGSEEYPTQSVTDIFGFFVDGVNFAVFPNGNLVGNNDDSQFIDNPLGEDLYAIEYNGFTPAFTIEGGLDPALSTHTAVIAIANTSDQIFDSGVFVSGIRAGTGEGGIGDPGDPGDPGEPGEPVAPVGVPALSGTGLVLASLLLMLLGLTVIRGRTS